MEFIDENGDSSIAASVESSPLVIQRACGQT